MNVKTHAVGTCIIVKPLDPPETVNGILIPDEARAAIIQRLGTIVSVGSDVKSKDLIVGEEICFTKGMLMTPNFETGEPLIATDEEHVVARIVRTGKASGPALKIASATEVEAVGQGK